MSALEGLRDEQLQMVQTYCDATGEEDPEHAARVLGQNGWDLNSAVARSMDGDATGAASGGQEPAAAPGAPEEPRQPTGFLASLVRMAARPVNAAIGTTLRLLDWVFSLVFFPLRLLAPPSPESSPADDAREFAASFRNKYGQDAAPHFVEDSISAASQRARNEDRLLLAYLHADENEDAEEFCRTVLCSPGFKSFAAENVLLWAGNVDRPEAQGLANELQATCFPFVALLSPRATGTQLAVVDRIEGFVRSEALVERVSAAMEAVQEVLERRRAERVSRQEERQLRDEQNRELEEAMARDRERLDRARREAERAAREEEERREREEREAKERAEAKAAREAAVARVPDEPARGTDGAVAIRFNLPDGSREQRRFLRKNTLGEVHAFVASALHERDSAIVRFVLSSNFPRRRYTEDEHERTLEELDFKGGVLFVQDLDA